LPDIYCLQANKQSTVFAFSFGAESDLFSLRVAYEYINDRKKDRQDERQDFKD
jgi:hypothetical protein